MRTFIYSASLIFLLALLPACTMVQTAPQRGSEKIETASVTPVPAGRGSREDSGIILAYEFINQNGEKLDADGNCRLRWMETTSRRSFFMTIDRTKNAAYVALPPGRYETGRMGCGITKVWDLGNILKGSVQVASGSASYAGKVSFVFAKKQLEVVEKASRSQHAAGYQSALRVLPENQRMVSGYNLIALTDEMANEGAQATGFDVHAQGIPTGPVLNGLLGQLRSCEPKATDPLLFGRLDYTAAYQKGRFAEFKSRRDANAFNDQFKTCVSDTLSGFRPPQSGPVEINVIY